MAIRFSRNADGGWSMWWRGALYSPHVRGAVGHKWRRLFHVRGWRNG